MTTRAKGRFWVHLAYMDESGASTQCPIALYGALLVEDRWLRAIERWSSLTAANLLPRSKRSEFKEFHAFDLITGRGVFETVEEAERLKAAGLLLAYAREMGTAFIYSAVDRSAFRAGPIAGVSEAMTLAFRMCLLGVEEVQRREAQRRHDAHLEIGDPLCFFIADDVKDATRKDPLKAEYKQLREQMGANPQALPRLYYAHDAMGWMDSTESIGLQIADLCAFVTLGALQGRTNDMEFFGKIKPIAQSAHGEPHWSTHQHLFLEA